MVCSLSGAVVLGYQWVLRMGARRRWWVNIPISAREAQNVKKTRTQEPDLLNFQEVKERAHSDVLHENS